jgi:hypothetical protein
MTKKIAQLCRRFGRYRPRLVSRGQPASLVEGLVLSANERAISLQPSYISHLSIPNVVMVPIADKQATWDLFLVWQRGKMSGPLSDLSGSLHLNPKPYPNMPT